jgi:hypothetical protein
METALRIEKSGKKPEIRKLFPNFRFAIDSELIHVVLHPHKAADTDDEIEERTQIKMKALI